MIVIFINAEPQAQPPFSANALIFDVAYILMVTLKVNGKMTVR
jgi:hypothetical protein